MRTYRGPTTLILTVMTLFLLSGSLLACGPADESVQRELGQLSVAAPQGDGNEPTPEPTVNEYPNLDETLAELVQKYESGELSEEEAAALAPDYEGRRVLVQVEAPADSVDTLDAWMGEKGINPRYTDPDYAWPLVYAYPRVSVLGALSEQDGVTLVKALKSRNPSAVLHYPKPPLPVARTADGTPLPELPGWLKGYPHPRTYHEYDGGALSILMDHYDDGKVTDENIDQLNRIVGCGVDVDGRVSLSLRVQNNPTALETVRTWLAERGITVKLEREGDALGVKSLLVSLRPSEIKEVAELVDVARAYFYPCTSRPGSENSYEYLEELRKHKAEETETEEGDGAENKSSSAPDTTPRYEAITVYGASAWRHHSAGVKVGIIDQGFVRLDNLIADNSLLTESSFVAHCYTDDFSSSFSSSVSDCMSANQVHGTAMVEGVHDLAPFATFVISNAGYGEGPEVTRVRFRSVVETMVTEKVDVIVLALGYHYDEGLGDGVARELNAIHDSVDYAANLGIPWVIAAGNGEKSNWRGSFQDLNNNGFHEFDGHEYLTVQTTDGSTPLGSANFSVWLRWHDSWEGSDCDLDLEVHRLNTLIVNPTLEQVYTFEGIKPQSGHPSHRPYETILVEGEVGYKYFVKVTEFNCSNIENLGWVQVRIGNTLRSAPSDTGYSLVIPADSDHRMGSIPVWGRIVR